MSDARRSLCVFVRLSRIQFDYQASLCRRRTVAVRTFLKASAFPRSLRSSGDADLGGQFSPRRAVLLLVVRHGNHVRRPFSTTMFSGLRHREALWLQLARSRG